jgi:hypothetical protein
MQHYEESESQFLRRQSNTTSAAAATASARRRSTALKQLGTTGKQNGSGRMSVRLKRALTNSFVGDAGDPRLKFQKSRR